MSIIYSEDKNSFKLKTKIGKNAAKDTRFFTISTTFIRDNLADIYYTLNSLDQVKYIYFTGHKKHYFIKTGMKHFPIFLFRQTFFGKCSSISYLIDKIYVCNRFVFSPYCPLDSTNHSTNATICTNKKRNKKIPKICNEF